MWSWSTSLNEESFKHRAEVQLEELKIQSEIERCDESITQTKHAILRASAAKEASTVRMHSARILRLEAQKEKLNKMLLTLHTISDAVQLAVVQNDISTLMDQSVRIAEKFAQKTEAQKGKGKKLQEATAKLNDFVADLSVTTDEMSPMTEEEQLRVESSVREFEAMERMRMLGVVPTHEPVVEADVLAKIHKITNTSSVSNTDSAASVLLSSSHA